MPDSDAALPIVLIPGLACSAGLFGPQLPALSCFGPLMVADHTRGETIAALAQNVLRYAPEKFVLAGLSMGGYIALEIMRQAPQRVIALILMDTSARPDSGQDRQDRERMVELALQGKRELVAQLSYPRLVHASSLNDQALRLAVQKATEDSSLQAYVRQQKAIMGRIDSRPTLGDIRCPCLILVGDSDQLTPPGHAREMQQLIPGARLEIIARCGHLCTLERPQKVTRTLLHRLNQLRQQQQA